jgi:hypothetical protein
VTTSILLSLVLLTPPPTTPHATLPGVVEPHAGAWAVVHAGQLWVCWRQGPDCWRRVELEDDVGLDADTELEDLALQFDEENDDALDPDFLQDGFSLELEIGPERWRLGFDGATNLWIELDDRRWRVAHGQTRARVADDATPVRLARPLDGDCGPDGQRPAIVGGRLGWQVAPRCAEPPPRATCVASSPSAARPRKPVPIRLRAGIELGVVLGWTAVDTDATTPTVASVRQSAGLELLFVVELGFDPTRTNADARARAALLSHDRVRHIPASSPGPLAAAEQQAMLAGICGGQP